MKISYLGVLVCAGSFSDDTVQEICEDYCFHNKIEFNHSNISLTAETDLEVEQLIEKAIYSNYPSKKQNQDEKWVSSYTTKLKAIGVADLETKVVGMITSFFTGKTLAVVLKDVSAEQKPYFEKLVKVGVRTEWAEKCIIEGKTAIAENREPVYPEFPKFD